jgi:hypothetical protein
LKLTAAALLSTVLTAAAVAQDAAAPAAPSAPAAPDQPAAAPATPSAPQNALPVAAPPQPVAPAASADLQSCMEETGDFVTRGRVTSYVIGLINSCDKRLRCEIFANISGARGTSLGHTVMILGAKSAGAGAKKAMPSG